MRRSEWGLPRSVAVVVGVDAGIQRLRDRLPVGSLTMVDDLPDPMCSAPGVGAAIVPDASRPSRSRLLRSLTGVRAVLGPTVAVAEVPRSFRWAASLWIADLNGAADVVDADERVVDVLLAAEPAVVIELRRRHLGPLEQLTPAARERLEDTLRAWLDLRGRHDLVAAALHVHPQTVRYRIGQLHRLIGPAMSDPDRALPLRWH